jgi:small redox-active disulfide protein 2
MLHVKVLGSGCANCARLEALARQAIATLGIDARIEKITDPVQWRRYGLLATPGLVVGEKLVSAGRIPGEAEIVTWLADALEPA